MKEVMDTEVVVGEYVATQHRMVVSTMVAYPKWKRAPKAVKKIKRWKLKDPNVEKKFKTEVIESRILGGQQDWQKVDDKIRSIARMELGEKSGKVSTSNECQTWWWNQEVQKLKNKKKAKKVWDTTRGDVSKKRS